MITITFANPDGFIDKNYNTSDEAVSELKTLEEKDIYINHQPVEQELLSTNMLESANHIMIQDKLIGA